MTEGEFLRRFDEHLAAVRDHMARGNEIMARSDELMARSDALWAEARDADTRLRGSVDDVRIELRQTSLRGQRVAERFEAEVRASRAERAAARQEDRRFSRELVAELRAHRSALLAILDELRGGGPAAAGA